MKSANLPGFALATLGFSQGQYKALCPSRDNALGSYGAGTVQVQYSCDRVGYNTIGFPQPSVSPEACALLCKIAPNCKGSAWQYHGPTCQLFADGKPNTTTKVAGAVFMSLDGSKHSTAPPRDSISNFADTEALQTCQAEKTSLTDKLEECKKTNEVYEDTLSACADPEAVKTCTKEKDAIGNDLEKCKKTSKSQTDKLAACADPEAAKTCAKERDGISDELEECKNASKSQADKLAACGDPEVAKTCAKDKDVISDDLEECKKTSKAQEDKLAACADPEAAKECTKELDQAKATCTKDKNDFQSKLKECTDNAVKNAESPVWTRRRNALEVCGRNGRKTIPAGRYTYTSNCGRLATTGNFYRQETLGVDACLQACSADTKCKSVNYNIMDDAHCKMFTTGATKPVAVKGDSECPRNLVIGFTPTTAK